MEDTAPTVRIHIVTEDPVLGALLTAILKRNGIASAIVATSALLCDYAQPESAELLLLDQNLHNVDIPACIRKIRETNNWTGIFILAEPDKTDALLAALQAGADNYQMRPFSAVLFPALMQSMLHRRNFLFQNSENILHCGPFLYNLTSLKLYRGHVLIPLTAKENAMMKFFFDHINVPLNKKTIYHQIWGPETPSNPVVMVYINRLRQKLEEDPTNPKFLLTIRGRGYMLTDGSGS